MQSNPKGAAHACSGNSFRGGVSRRFTRRLRGQSTVEYVLVIAIIGLVVLIAGPWVSSAIRNQFNTVAGTLGNGIDKGSWETGSTGGGNGSLTDADIVDPVHGTAFAVYSADDHVDVGDPYLPSLGLVQYSVDVLVHHRALAESLGVASGSEMIPVSFPRSHVALWLRNRVSV